MNPALQTSDNSLSAAQVETSTPPAGEVVYDAARERAVSRKLRNARWRRLVLLFSAVAVAGAAAGGFTMANKEALLASARHVPAETRGPTPASEPSLASATSRPVQLPTPSAVAPNAEVDPNKVQARVVMPADPEPAPSAPAPMQMQDSQGAAPRTIPLGGNRLVTTADSASDVPAAALGFAPVPAPRPSRAP